MTIGRKWRQQVVAARDKSHFAQARLVLPTRTLKEERNNASYAIVFLVIGSRICSSSWFARNKISLLGHCKTTGRTRFATCCGWKRSGQLPGSNRRTSAIAPASSMGSTQIKTSTTATQNTARQNIVGIPIITVSYSVQSKILWNYSGEHLNYFVKVGPSARQCFDWKEPSELRRKLAGPISVCV